MQYKKINLELIVPAHESESMVDELNSALDQMEERYEIYGGDTEVSAIEHCGTRKKSALSHTLAAGQTAVSAVMTARKRVKSALHLVL